MEYDGKERRKVTRMNDDLNTKLEVLTERVSNWMETTTEYRKELCVKINAISERVLDLPCKESQATTNGFKNQLRTLWVFVTGIVVVIIAEYIKKK